MKITIYNSNVIEKPNNTIYKNKHELDTSAQIDPSIFAFDYVGAKFKNNQRATANFISRDCVIIDIDNDHSDNPSDWFGREDVENLLGNVPHIIHYSRNHMLDKKQTNSKGTTTIKQRRPKMHVIIATKEISSEDEYKKLINRLSKYLPIIDEKALDVAHFFYGTANPKIEVFDGYMSLNELLDELEFSAYDSTDEIPEGKRNPTMHRFATRVLKRYGDSEEAITLFEERASHCNPLLPDAELKLIWRSAVSFYNKVIVVDPNYKLPDEYIDTNDYRPTDYSDVGQAHLIEKYFKNQIRYSSATHNIIYRENHWVESEAGAQAIAQELTDRQLKQAEHLIANAFKECKSLDVLSIISTVPKTKLETKLNEEQRDAYYEYRKALEFKDFVIKRRFSYNIAATIKESRPLVEIDSSLLDADANLFNTPDAVYDLRYGIDSKREHRPEDMMTKITTKSPSLAGKDLWLSSVNTIFGNNQELINYVQQMCGLALFGKVYFEGCIIAYGKGGNGKSTFFNSIGRVLGEYYGSLASDVLVTSIKRDKQADLAELRGRRLVIAAETKVGDRLDESTIKRMCSTDNISACKKYKDPFDFKPSHTLVIYTNNLPKVTTTDDGTWRRIVVIPFNHKFSGKEDIKNYEEVLVEKAGEYILYWLIEGAKKAYDNHFRIEPPAEVVDAIKGYRANSDTVSLFFNECVDTGDEKATCPCGELYSRYRNYCFNNGENPRSQLDFSESVQNMGFKKLKKNGRYFIKGASLDSLNSPSAVEDFEELLK